MGGVTVLLPSILAAEAGGQGRFDLEAETVGEALRALPVENMLFDERGELRRLVNVYVDGVDIRGGDGVESRAGRRRGATRRSGRSGRELFETSHVVKEASRAPSEGHVPTAGARLYYRAIGQGPPIIVLHGGPDFDHHYLLPEMDRLADSFRLIYYDQRGRGRSTAGVEPDEVSIGSEVEDLTACGATSVGLRCGAGPLVGWSPRDGVRDAPSRIACRN